MKALFKFLVRVFLPTLLAAISSYAEESKSSSEPAQAAAKTPAPTPVWANESQAAIVQTTGNSNTESNSLKHSTVYTKNKNVGKITGSYLKTKAENTSTGQNEKTARRELYSLTCCARFGDYFVRSCYRLFEVHEAGLRNYIRLSRQSPRGIRRGSCSWPGVVSPRR